MHVFTHKIVLCGNSAIELHRQKFANEMILYLTKRNTDQHFSGMAEKEHSRQHPGCSHYKYNLRPLSSQGPLCVHDACAFVTDLSHTINTNPLKVIPYN